MIDPFTAALGAGSILLGYKQQSDTRKASRQNAQATQEVIDDSTARIEEAQQLASQLIYYGMEDAASAIIEGTFEGISEVWRGAELGEDRLREFLGKATGYLMPTIQQGRYASDELARMLGIPNADGVKEPWDPSLIEETPGYKFQYEWGKRAVENSAVGRYLSGEQAMELTKFGQGLAGTYFDRRVDQLDRVAGRGDQAATAAGQLTNQAGGALAQLFGNAGQAAGNIALQGGLGLGEMYYGGGLAQGQLVADAASTIANLAIAGTTGLNTNRTSLQTSQNQFASDVLTGTLGLPGLLGGNTTQTTSAPSVDPASIASSFGISPLNPTGGIGTVGINNSPNFGGDIAQLAL